MTHEGTNITPECGESGASKPAEPIFSGKRNSSSYYESQRMAATAAQVANLVEGAAPEVSIYHADRTSQPMPSSESGSETWPAQT